MFIRLGRGESVVEIKPGQKKRYVSWSEIDRGCDVLARRIANNSDFDIRSVAGIPRGGLVVAVIVSHRLGLPYTTSASKSILLDDIVDSGKIMSKWVKVFNYKITGALYYKESSTFKPNFYYKIIPENVWLVFPWGERYD